MRSRLCSKAKVASCGRSFSWCYSSPFLYTGRPKYGIHHFMDCGPDYPDYFYRAFDCPRLALEHHFACHSIFMYVHPHTATLAPWHGVCETGCWLDVRGDIGYDTFELPRAGL